jgi:hypothetical protein
MMPTWGAPPPSAGYGHLPPYGAPSSSRRPKATSTAAKPESPPREDLSRKRPSRESSLSPVTLKPRSTSDREREEALYATMPPTPTESWDRSFYQGYHDTPAGRTSLAVPGTPLTSGGGSFGASRPHSPNPMQTDLYNMPLQSPNSHGFMPPSYLLASPSATIPLGFSPTPVGRLPDAHFPLPSLQGHEELPRWRGVGTSRDAHDFPDSRDASPDRSGGGHHPGAPPPPPRSDRR